MRIKKHHTNYTFVFSKHRCDEEDEIDLEDDEILSIFPDEKFYPGALEKMIGCVALLLEEARDGPELHLSDADMQCFLNNKDSPFIYQITADAVNLRQTANIIFHLSRYNEPFAEIIVQLLLNAAQRLSIDQSPPFFKLLSLLTEVGENGLPGRPSFTGMILPKIWQAADINPALTLDWLSNQVPRNKQAHQFVLQNLDRWVEKFLISDNNPRIRGGAAYLLVSLVPHHHFPQAFRGRMFTAPQKDSKEMTAEAKTILPQIYTFLLNLLPNQTRSKSTRQNSSHHV
jgi:ubiquitin carboxyl-terminal hydrolase 34